ncbi:MAG: hypothetical protein A8274_54 [Halanaerobium sp. 4-GBenrich]|jgi:hypothetical protein|uniref:Helix-hairpin-helix containing domain-containing protein n=1 Tax=Halanaerobium congolense TaxID=54121 RepID=A0A1G6IS22_9FIRM|nr:helix-hairpin-helix domain-containing protein [Halanaerobium congolense]KXS47813.1 MAG: hypothetical protein AWL62_2395 [Halanaerobium sp. T82-1]ODS50966.1 MAG: hypothetical protein A8274_54 [Halanaerobium sp. 4-GBenrich]TDS33913.1 helix-hairpin-helix protein [Halanaerobium congolense]SDC09223.1 Helix-hairpin-helix containing domain-containing protein [Halanaerobium congolense]
MSDTTTAVILRVIVSGSIISKKGMTLEKILKDHLDNPYQLIDEIDKVGFTKADKIVLSLNDNKKLIFKIKSLPPFFI